MVSAEEERLMVLKMLEEGKVSAAEAAELLRALGRKAAGPGAGPDAGPDIGWPHMWGMGGMWGMRPGRKIRHGVRAFVREVLDSMPFEAGPGPFPWGGRHHRLEEMMEGKFAAEARSIRLEFRVRGRLSLRAWDGPGYQLLVVRRAYGPDEAEVRQRAAESGGVKKGDDFLQFEAEGWEPGWTVVEAWLPRSLTYTARLRSDNGRIETDGLSFSDLEARAENGRLSLRNCRADKAALYAANGSIRAQVSAARLMAQAGNGRLVVAPGRDRSGEYRLRSENGSVEVLLEPGPGVGYSVEAQATLGHVHREELPELEVGRERLGPVGQSLVGRTRGFDEQPVKVAVTATANHGHVRLLRAGLEGGWDGSEFGFEGGPQFAPEGGPECGPQAGPAPGAGASGTPEPGAGAGGTPEPGAGGAPLSGTGTDDGPAGGAGSAPGSAPEEPHGGGEA